MDDLIKFAEIDTVRSELLKRLKRKGGELLLAIRKDKRMRQEDIAEQLEIHPSMISRIEKGYSEIPVKTLLKLAKLVGNGRENKRNSNPLDEP